MPFLAAHAVVLCQVGEGYPAAVAERLHGAATIHVPHGCRCCVVNDHILTQLRIEGCDFHVRFVVASGHRRQAARVFFDAKPGRRSTDDFPAVVNGFTGSSIWHSIYAFPPTSQAYWDKGFADFGKRFGPILEAFDKVNVNFGLEVHPTEIAFDIASSQRAIEAVKGHKRFGFNYDPSHLGYQGVDYVKFIRAFGNRIYHAHMKDVWWGHGDGTVGVFGGHVGFGDARRFWDFRSLGHGDIKFEDIIVALNDVGYRGPLSVEWEDIRMDRVHGATEAAAFVRKVDFPSSALAFDAAFERK